VDVFERQRKLQHQRRQCEIGCASPGEAPCDAPAKELFPFWLGVPFLTTMHGRLDLPGAFRRDAVVSRGEPANPLVGKCSTEFRDTTQTVGLLVSL